MFTTDNRQSLISKFHVDRKTEKHNWKLSSTSPTNKSHAWSRIIWIHIKIVPNTFTTFSASRSQVKLQNNWTTECVIFAQHLRQIFVGVANKSYVLFYNLYWIRSVFIFLYNHELIHFKNSKICDKSMLNNFDGNL